MVGSFLAQVAADGVQIFLETHSEPRRLIGIRVAVADGRAALHPNQAGSPPSFAQKTMKARCFKRWNSAEPVSSPTGPPGFFDQTQVELAALVSRRRRKP